ncbi:MAG: hypothetical protein DMG27_18560 [Acidobacteria bacterium]|nr:MAG: hypothetical protein DMG27_18560 [Acidobacteriota bacterium]
MTAILSQYYEQDSEGGDLTRVLARLKRRDWPDLRDAWDTELRIEPALWDLGIPPGFDLLSEDLQDYQNKSASLKSGHLSKFSLTATQAILYFIAFAPGDTVTVKFRLRAKYPIRARTFKSRAYEYYDPEVSSVARPVQLEVRKR